MKRTACTGRGVDRRAYGTAPFLAIRTSSTFPGLRQSRLCAGPARDIHPDKATPSDLLSGQPTPLEDEETTHFSIIDADGNRVAATQTVNLLYGSGLIPKGTGVLLNDEMDDFALKPGTPNAFGVMGYDANAPEPGKRMLSSMTPTFMESADKVAVLGTLAAVAYHHGAAGHARYDAGWARRKWLRYRATTTNGFRT